MTSLVQAGCSPRAFSLLGRISLYVTYGKFVFSASSVAHLWRRLLYMIFKPSNVTTRAAERVAISYRNTVRTSSVYTEAMRSEKE